MKTQSLAELLESALDAKGVQVVCETLREVCFAKAQHVSENWQDSNLESLWNQAAFRFDDFADWAAATGHPSFKAGK